MINLFQWAARHQVPQHALDELCHMVGVAAHEGLHDSHSESYVSKIVRVEASQKDCILWRNNVGALKDERGIPVRYGLANDSKKMNERVKSHDLIGIRKVHITQQHVGVVIGQFLSRETKREGWSFSPNDQHSLAQLKFAEIVLAFGGDAAFATSEGTI